MPSGRADFAARSTVTGPRLLDFDDLADLAGKMIAQPSCFIAGERDLVRSFVPGTDLYGVRVSAPPIFVAPQLFPASAIGSSRRRLETNAALEKFLRGL